MKLKSNFIIQDVEDARFLIPLGGNAFHGILKNNEVAAFIVECLKKDTSLEEIVDAVYNEYDMDRETIEKDVKEVLETFRSVDALEES